MSNHLPECPATEVSMSGHSTPPPDYELTYTVCICDRLRACEQRAFAEGLARRPTCEYDRKRGYANGVQAARDAVAALPINAMDWDYRPHESYGHIRDSIRQEALAAIDNIITKNSGENYG